MNGTRPTDGPYGDAGPTGDHAERLTCRGDELSAHVVDAVAAARGVDATELPPLHDAVDTEALEALFEPRPSGQARRDGAVWFEYGGCTVVVHSHGAVVVV